MASLYIHLVATWAMVAIIWFVQISHYPLMHYVGKGQMMEYQKANLRKTAWVVFPFMRAELLSGFYIYYFSLLPKEALFYVAFFLILFIWAYTFLVVVPIHLKLKKEPTDASIKKLIFLNWPRTILWSFRGMILAFLLL